MTETTDSLLEKPVLSIVIPTYNRADLLETSLRLLLPQVMEYGCEVVVTDNASTDHTAGVVKEFQHEYANINYICQPSNLGYDRNVLTGYRHAQGKYVWLLGDAYCISKDGFRAVMELLIAGDSDAVVVNGKQRVQGIPSRRYTDASELMHDLGWHMTLLNSFIMPASFAKEAINERYIGTYFIHFGVFYENIVRIKEPRIEWLSVNVTDDTLTDRSRGHLRGGGWLNTLFEVLVTNYFTLIMSLPHQLSLAAKLKCIADHDRHTRMFSPLRLLRLRGNGVIHTCDFKANKQFLHFCTETPYYQIWLVFALPLGVLKAAQWMQRRLKR